MGNERQIAPIFVVTCQDTEVFLPNGPIVGVFATEEAAIAAAEQIVAEESRGHSDDEWVTGAVAEDNLNENTECRVVFCRELLGRVGKLVTVTQVCAGGAK